MEIKVKGKIVELRYSLRIYLIFEQMVGRMINPKLSGDVVMLFLAAIMSSSPECEITLDSLIDMVDENPIILDNFNEWYSSEVKKNESKKKKMKASQ